MNANVRVMRVGVFLCVFRFPSVCDDRYAVERKCMCTRVVLVFLSFVCLCCVGEVCIMPPFVEHVLCLCCVGEVYIMPPFVEHVVAACRAGLHDERLFFFAFFKSALAVVVINLIWLD